MRRALVASASIVGLLLFPVLPTSAKKKAPPIGLIAASVGDQVVVVDPSSGLSHSFDTGPVAWLFPAPGGVLYAPDLVNSRTSVIDLRSGSLRELMDGVTMPRFGGQADRYVVVGGRVLIVSYPERALINAIDTEIEHPWQAEVVARDRLLLVLERQRGVVGEAVLTAVMLDEGRPVYRRPLAGDVLRFAVSEALGVLALVDAAAGSVRLLDPATAMPLAEYDFAGRPSDLAFSGDGTELVVVVDDGPGAGLLTESSFKPDKAGVPQRRLRWQHVLGGAPQRLALSPDRRHAAVALTDGRLEIVDLKRQQRLGFAELPSVPRDLVWIDPAVPGPLLPDWSDRNAPAIDLGDPARDFFTKDPG